MNVRRMIDFLVLGDFKEPLGFLDWSLGGSKEIRKMQFSKNDYTSITYCTEWDSFFFFFYKYCFGRDNESLCL